MIARAGAVPGAGDAVIGERLGAADDGWALLDAVAALADLLGLGAGAPHATTATASGNTTTIERSIARMLAGIARRSRLVRCRLEGPMIDRLISGAGAVSHLADRTLRAFSRGERAATSPVGLVLAAILGIAAVGGVALALENSGDRTLRELTAADAASRDHGDRAYTTIAGGLPSAYVETFRDENSDGQQQADEKGEAWNYFLVDPATRTGVTVQSDRSPAEVYTYTARGVVVDDAAYVAEDASQFQPFLEETGVTLEPSRYVDTTKTGSFQPTTLAAGLPAGGAAVELSGSRSVDYLTVCSADANNDGVCSEKEVDLWDVLVYDPVSKKAATVLTSVSPEFSPASFTGLLRRSPSRVTEAQRMDNDAFQLSDMNITVSPDYLLDDGDRPTDPIALLIPAIVALLAAAVIVIGAIGGLVRFRPGGGWPSRVATFTPGERMPVHVTGLLRTPTGPTQVREVDAELVRYVMAPAAAPAIADATPEPIPPTTDAAPPPAEAAEAADAAEVAEVAQAAEAAEPPPGDPPTTVIIERRGRPQGVAVGRGELTSITPGTVSPLRGSRPALRLTAGTGTLLVSFDSQAERDRAAAELAAEADIGGRH